MAAKAENNFVAVTHLLQLLFFLLDFVELSIERCDFRQKVVSFNGENAQTLHTKKGVGEIQLLWKEMSTSKFEIRCILKGRRAIFIALNGKWTIER